MDKSIAYIILEELREFRAETKSRLTSLEETRSEQRGMVKVSGLFVMSMSGLIAWLVGWLHK